MTIGWRINSVTAHCNLVTTPDPRRILHTCTCNFSQQLKISPENSSITCSGLSTASRLCGTAPCTTPYCWTESLLMARRFTWLCPHISRSVSILCCFICFKVVLYPYRCWHKNICCPLLTVGPLYPACYYYQRHLHGLLLPRRQDLPSSVPQKPVCERILQNPRLV